jgi:hypothetical protein
MQDACSLDVLVVNTREILGLPKRVFFEIVLKLVIQGSDKWNWLPPAFSAHCCEQALILFADELLQVLRIAVMQRL